MGGGAPGRVGRGGGHGDVVAGCSTSTRGGGGGGGLHVLVGGGEGEGRTAGRSIES